MILQKGEDVGFLLKFVEREHLSSFLNGYINFSPLKYFVDKAAKDDDRFIADEREGFLKIDLRDAQFKVSVDENQTEVLTFNSPTTAQISLDEDDKERVGIASFFFLNMNDFEFVGKNKAKDESEFMLKSSVVNYLKEFNEDNRIPVIIDIYKLSTILKNDKRKKNFRRVKYYDRNDFNSLKEEFKNGIPYSMIPFYKEKKYKEQREWRIVSRLNKKGKNERFNFGNLKDIAVPFSNNKLIKIGMIFEHLTIYEEK